jgi:hypothetical protein
MAAEPRTGRAAVASHAAGLFAYFDKILSLQNGLCHLKTCKYSGIAFILAPPAEAILTINKIITFGLTNAKLGILAFIKISVGL